MAPELKQLTSSLPTSKISGESRRDWLALSWLYPNSFGKPRLINDYNSVLVRGDAVEYKFLLSAEDLSTRSRGGAFERWLEACEEVADHRLSAPGLYQGIRALSWSDGEPVWLHDEPCLDFEPPDQRLLNNVSDIAIVRSRISNRCLFANQLNSQPERALHLTARVARSLVGFHRSSQVAAPIDFDRVAQAGEALRREARFCGRNLIAQTIPGSLLEFVCQELMSHLERFLSGPYGAIRKAVKTGLVIDCHGGLEMNNVAINVDGMSKQRPIFFGRPPRTDCARINYALSDLASLHLDMIAHGHTSCAKSLLKEYFARAPEVRNDELLRSLAVWSAVRRSSQIADECSMEPAEEQQLVSSRLAAAYRLLLELDRPRVILISGSVSNRETIVPALAELLNAEIVGIEGKPSEQTPQFDAVEAVARKAFRCGAPLIISADSLSRPLLELSLGLGRNHGLAATNISLRSELDREAPSAFDDWTSFTACNVVELEASLPMPEMCREILYTIRHQ